MRERYAVKTVVAAEKQRTVEQTHWTMTKTEVIHLK